VSVWDDLIGQDDAVAVLQRAAAAAAAIAAGNDAPGGAMTHAWLFTGPAGSGRSVAARAFAAALQCEREPAGCGEHPKHGLTHRHRLVLCQLCNER